MSLPRPTPNIQSRHTAPDLQLRSRGTVPADNPTARRTKLSLWIAAASSALLLLLLATFLFNLSTAWVLTGICTIALVILVPVYNSLSFRFRSLDPFSPYVLFPLAYIVWFAAGSVDFVQVPPDLAQFGGAAFEPIPTSMYGLYALGLGCYFLGLFLGRLLPNGGDAKEEPAIDIVKMQRVVQILLITTLVFWAATQLQFGLPVLHPGQAGLARLEIHGLFFQAFITLSWTSFVFSPVYIWMRGGHDRNDWFWLYAVPLIIFALLMSLGARSRAAVPLLVLIIARCYLRQRPTWKLFFGSAVVFCLFSVFGFYRDDTSWDLLFLTESGLPAPVVPFVFSALYIRYTVDAFRNLIQLFPQHIPFQHGAVTLTPLQALLPGHHDMSDIYFKKILGRDFEGSGQPATLLAPLYVDFGRAGIAAGMALYGVLLSWSFKRIKSRRSFVAAINYAWWMQATILALYSNGYAYINVFIMPLFWVLLLVRARRNAPLPHFSRARTLL